MATSSVSPPDPERATEDADLPDPSRTSMAWAAAFFAAASAVLERMLELASPFIPWWDYPTGDAIAQKKADRGYALITITAFLGVLASAASGLYLADAIGLSLTRWSDILLTGIAIGAGTKAIHEVIKSLEKAKGAGTAPG